MTLSELKRYNENWFSRKNKKFFGDISYRVLQGKISKKYFLIRHTNGFLDMFGLPKKSFYTINLIDENNFIGNMLDERFCDLESVKEFLKVN